jgi:hypothetical protein
MHLRAFGIERFIRLTHLVVGKALIVTHARCVRAAAYVSIRQHTSAYVRIREHTWAYVSIRQHTSAYVSIRQHTPTYVSIRQHTSAYVSIRKHTQACVSIRQHTSHQLLRRKPSYSLQMYTTFIQPQYSLHTALIYPEYSLNRVVKSLNTAVELIYSLIYSCIHWFNTPSFIFESIHSFDTPGALEGLDVSM